MIITLCGSARYEAEYKYLMEKLTLLGHVVIGLASYLSEHDGNKDWYTTAEKEVLDRIHLWKIEMSNCILVIDCHIDMENTVNVAIKKQIEGEEKPILTETHITCGASYIGVSTHNKIEHAMKLEKYVLRLSHFPLLLDLYNRAYVISHIINATSKGEALA